MPPAPTATKRVPSAEQATPDQFVMGALVSIQVCAEARGSTAAKSSDAASNRKVVFIVRDSPIEALKTWFYKPLIHFIRIANLQALGEVMPQ